MNVNVAQQNACPGTARSKGKVAIVTGSTSGIGLGIARGFAAAGASIVLNGFGKPDEIEDASREIESDATACALPIPRRHVRRRVDRGAWSTPTLDAVRTRRHRRQQCRHPARCAARNVSAGEVGRDPGDQPLLGFPHDAPGAAIECARSKWGRIINVASAHGLVASPFKSAYVAAKHGMVGPDQGNGARDRRGRHHLQRHLPRLRLHAAG